MQHRDAVGFVGCGTEMLRAGRQLGLVSTNMQQQAGW